MSSQPDDVVIRLSHPEDRDRVLGFIAEMGFNPRDAVTWGGLKMFAMTAWQGARLVGAIPMEPRPFQLRPGCVVPAVHQTTVAVAPEYRGGGIGSRMQRAILAHQPALGALATVFREDPASRAYRWYAANGFAPVMTVRAWTLADPAVAHQPDPPDVRDPDDPAVDWPAIEELWRENPVQCCGGFVCRACRPLRDWLRVHPYRHQYTFKLLLLHEADAALGAYALLGVGRLHSETTRVEIMEHAVRDDSARRLDRLLDAAVTYARQNDYRPVRWAMTSTNPASALAGRRGFEADWQFDMLARLLQPNAFNLPEESERSQLWRYYSLDYA